MSKSSIFRIGRKSEREAKEEARRYQAMKGREREMKERQQLIFNTYCIGVGRAGIHLLDAMYALDIETGVNQIYPLALPSSRYDYQLADNLGERGEHIFPFGDSNRDVRYSGVGGDQHLGQRIAFEEGRRIMNRVDEDFSVIDKRTPVRAIMLIGSLAGGTGGGAIPLLAKMIKDNFPDQLLVIMGLLPEKQEGNTFFVNASRSYAMITRLREELRDRYVDTVFIFENMIVRKERMLQSYDYINQEVAKSFNLLFGSSYSPDALDPYDRLSILKKGGEKGIGMMYYTSDQVDKLSSQTDKEIEYTKPAIIRLLHKNLARYPARTVETGRFGAYQVRSDQNIFPFDLRNILNSNFESILETGDKEKQAFIKGGFWPNPGSDKVEIATMLLEINPKEYEYLDKIAGMWNIWYDKEGILNDFEQIRTVEITI